MPAAGLSQVSGSLRGMGMATSRAPIEPTAEQRLLLSLAAWSTWSVGVGAALWRMGRRDGERALGNAGRMTVAWGLADAAVAGWGARRVWARAQAPGGGPGEAGRARRMALLTGAN